MIQGEVMTHKIIGRMYTVAPGRLYAGPIPSSPDPDEIVAVLKHPIDNWQIRSFLNLMEEGETNYQGQPFNSYIEAARELNPEVDMARMAIPDYTAPSAEFMKKILDFIDARIAAEKPVYVHCWGGLGRTGVVVGCWLKRHGEADPLSKLVQLRSVTINPHQESPQSPDQFALIKDWQRGS